MPPEALELVVAAGPSLASALRPLLASFARVSGIGVRRARLLARELAGVLSSACRTRGRVRVSLDGTSRSLKVLVRFAHRARRTPRPATRRSGLKVVRCGRGVLVLALTDRQRHPARASS
jgi:hypothetical protein